MNVQTETKTDASSNIPQDGINPKGQESTEDAGTNPEAKDQESKELGWTPEQKSYVEDLRKENAKHRTRAKELDSRLATTEDRFSKIETGLKNLFGEEEDTLSPEEKIEALNARNEALELNQAISETAEEYGVTGEDKDYFTYLLANELQGLEENEEITEEQLDAIAKKARARSASSSTSIEDDGPNPEAAPGGMTLDKFQVMGIMDRSKLYGQDPKLYNSLLEQEKLAKTKK